MNIKIENKIERYEEIRYYLEVEHEPETFDNDMDFLTKNPKDAYKRLQFLKREYSSKKITITNIKEVTTREPLSESDLEILANQH